MSASNAVSLLGRVGRDATSTVFQRGSCVIEFSIATTEKWNDRDGQRQEKTVWHNCKKFAKSDGLAQYIKKGDMLGVQGSIDVEEWDDKKSGEKKSRQIIKVFDVAFAGSGGGGQSSGGGQSAPSKGGFGDDDIPF